MQPNCAACRCGPSRPTRSAAAEGRLGELGWYDDGATRMSFWTGANDSPVVSIDPGILLWERLQLSDGTLARLVTSLPAG